MSNQDVRLTLDDSVAEVLGILTGQDLSYDPQQDRYVAITRALNRALRANALEHEWSFYSSTEEIGKTREGVTTYFLRNSLRPRIIADDAVQLKHEGTPVLWCYFLPRDALSKYVGREGLWASVTRNELHFSRGFYGGEVGLDIHVPVMREPKVFRLPEQPEDPLAPLVAVPQQVREQELDFDYPDVIVVRAAWYVAQSDPVMQPRAQTLEAQYKDLMYQLIERDDRHTDSPYQNEWNLGIQNSLSDLGPARAHGHPHADERRFG